MEAYGRGSCETIVLALMSNFLLVVDRRIPLLTPFMEKTIFLENLFNNVLRHTSLIVSQIATYIFLPPALSNLYLIKFFLIQR